MAKLGQCCEVMRLVLSREASNGLGIVWGTRMNFKTGETSDAIVVRFRKAKRTEDQKHAAATWAWVVHCPFCGAETGAKGP